MLVKFKIKKADLWENIRPTENIIKSAICNQKPIEKARQQDNSGILKIYGNNSHTII